MELVTFKEEISTDYGESSIESISINPTNNIAEHTKDKEILKLQRKKCGEIFIYNEDVFDILCTLCKTPAAFEEIEKFFVHVKYSHKEENGIDKNDPLEAKNEDNFNENIKCEPIIDLNVLKNDEDEIKVTKIPEKNSNNDSLPIICHSNSKDNPKIKLLKKSESKGNDYKRRRTKNNVRIKTKKIKSIETQDKVEEEEEDVSCLTEEAQDIENDSLKCKHCGRRLADSSTLIEHERIHTGERPCQCQICGKQFRTRSCVWRHEKIHSNVRKFECDKCTLSFKSKAGLNAHMLRHGEKTIPCSYCDKLFHLKAAKLEHERVHTGEKPYQCNYCGKCFQTGGHLHRHSRTHTGVKPYKCPHCDRSFATKAILDNHIVIHTGERPFTCTTCNATFPRKKALKSHEKIHSDYRGYVCKICGEAFKQYPTLHGHMKSHRRVQSKSEAFPN